MSDNIINSVAEKLGISTIEVEKLWHKSSAIASKNLGVNSGEQFDRYAENVLKNMVTLTSCSNALSIKPTSTVKPKTIDHVREREIHAIANTELARLKPVLAKKRGVVKKAVAAIQKFQTKHVLTMDEKKYIHELIQVIIHHTCHHIEELNPMLHKCTELGKKYAEYLGNSFNRKELFDRNSYGYEQVRYDSSISPLVLETDDSEPSVLTSLLSDIISWSLRECNLTKQHIGSTNANPKYGTNSKLMPTTIRN